MNKRLLTVVFLILGILAFASLQGAMADSTFKIAFDSDRDGNKEIYVMDADGNNPVRLTKTQADDYYPMWSPDGGKIAFVSKRDGKPEIYAMNADGGSQTRLTNNNADDWSPAWSPDGGKIVFVSNRDKNAEIYVMNADGSGQTRLTTNKNVDDLYPSWSPDGTKVLFTSGESVCVMNSDGGGKKKLAMGYEPVWSPDGKSIAYTYTPSQSEPESNEIYIVNAAGGKKTRITNNEYIDKQPQWSPDGTRIVYGCRCDVMMVGADGRNQTKITGFMLGYPQSFRWSPDGNTVVFVLRGALGEMEIYSFNVANNNLARLAMWGKSDNPSLSPK